jgi:uncharacterized membrane protein (UPF0127 family)
LLGLSLVEKLPPDRGLLIPRCRSVHTVGMRFVIDVAFVTWPPVEGAVRVVATRERMRPARLAAARGAWPAAALELPVSGAIRLGLAPGAVVRFATPPAQ